MMTNQVYILLCLLGNLQATTTRTMFILPPNDNNGDDDNYNNGHDDRRVTVTTIMTTIPLENVTSFIRITSLESSTTITIPLENATSFIRIMSLALSSPIMGKRLAANIHATSTSDISLLEQMTKTNQAYILLCLSGNLQATTTHTMFILPPTIMTVTIIVKTIPLDNAML